MENNKETEGLFTTRGSVYVRPTNIKSKTQKLIFAPQPKQRFHYELISIIPLLGHELDCPIELDLFPYAKYTWLSLIDLDKETGVLTEAKREMLFSYCLLCERLHCCILQWNGNDITKINTKEVYKDYLKSEIDRLTLEVAKVGKQLGVNNIGKKTVVKEEVEYECEEPRNEEVEKTGGNDMFD